jgi:DNA processing protein
LDGRALRRGDRDYPEDLERLTDPPALLHVAGLWPLAAGVAIVGSRAATPAGRRMAADLAAAVAACGLPVLSGLARGIDAAAHEGALEAGGPTVAVLGSGLDRIYPPEHAPLARRIAERGAVLTEYAPGTPPRPGHFPRRNRLLAALARVVVVVEAGERSGALITARLALDLGRDVLAVPGWPEAPLARGPNGLIKRGAGLVEGPDDVLAALGLPAGPPFDRATRQAVVSGDGAEVLRVLTHGPATVDEIVARSGLPADRVVSALLRLELSGVVDPPVGQVYGARHNIRRTG